MLKPYVKHLVTFGKHFKRRNICEQIPVKIDNLELPYQHLYQVCYRGIFLSTFISSLLCWDLSINIYIKFVILGSFYQHLYQVCYPGIFLSTFILKKHNICVQNLVICCLYNTHFLFMRGTHYEPYICPANCCTISPSG